MTTKSSKPAYPEQEIKFLKSLQKHLEIQLPEHLNVYGKEDKAAKAAFKRALSGEPEHLRKIYEFVLPHFTYQKPYQQDKVWIPVACLYVFYPQHIEEDEESRRRSFGISCRGLATATSSEGADRRFKAFLDMSLEDLRSPLNALVRQMKSKGIAIDYPKLIADLQRWEHPNQFIQDQWARDFWGVHKPQDEEEQVMSE
jgi:CRISPR system Cascade subunit CasB